MSLVRLTPHISLYSCFLLEQFIFIFLFLADLQRPLVEQPCEDELDPWGCSFYIIFGSKGCNSKKMEKECRYSCNLCEITLWLNVSTLIGSNNDLNLFIPKMLKESLISPQ